MDKIISVVNFLLTVGGKEPIQIARTMLLYLVIGYATGRFSKSVFERGLKNTIFGIGIFVASNIAKGSVDKELERVKGEFEKDLIYKHEATQTAPKFHVLPKHGMKAPQLRAMLKEWSKYDNQHWNGNKKLSSGSVYHGGKDLMDLQCDIFRLFCVTNPLHPESFPFVRKMESEVISMVLALFHGSPFKQCGLLTSGGTESIIMAIRAYKIWARQEKGIRFPELIIPQTAHAAFWKGCQMFGIKIVLVKVETKDMRVDPLEIEKVITKNTIAIIGSCPQYAQGVIDPFPELSKLAIKYKIGLHVDCCLGSFMMPFLDQLGFDLPLFDFRLPGVTSISCDTHKFGYATKGTSTVLFREKKYRHYAYFLFTESSIGWYGTPTVAGSRSGGLIAATWAAMVHMGNDGYKHDFEQMMQAVNKVREAIDAMDYMEIIGDPVMSVLSFRPTDRNIHPFKVSDALSKRGWTLNNCQMPACMHICFTHATYPKVDKFIKDLKDAFQDVIENPEVYEKSSGAVYGTMVEIPAEGLKTDILQQYLDVMLGVY